MPQVLIGILKRAVIFICGTAIGQGILLFLGKLDIHPEKAVAAMLGVAYENLDVLAWTLAGTLGLAAVIIYEIVQRRFAPARVVAPRPQPTVPAPIIAGDTKPLPNMLIKQAAEYLAATNPTWDAASDEVWAELRQAARDGRMTVWGHPESAHLAQPYKPMEEIPPDHWRHYGFDFLRCMHGEDEALCRSEPDDIKRHPLTDGYAGLRVNRAQVARLWVASIPPNALAIIIGEGAPFHRFKNRIYLRNHRISVGVTNRMIQRPAANCELILEGISGWLSSRCPIKIKTNFSLNAGATEYVPLAEFDERIDETRPAPSEPGLILVHFPINPLSDQKSYLDPGSYELSLLATSADTPATRIKCRLSLRNGFLSLEEI